MQQQIAVDTEYLKRMIEHLSQERKVHDQKFADNPHHANCLPRFDAAITKLQQELQKAQASV